MMSDKWIDLNWDEIQYKTEDGNWHTVTEVKDSKIARRIIECVNSHDTLTARMQELEQLLEVSDSYYVAYQNMCFDRDAYIEKLIALCTRLNTRSITCGACGGQHGEHKDGCEYVTLCLGGGDGG